MAARPGLALRPMCPRGESCCRAPLPTDQGKAGVLKVRGNFFFPFSPSQGAVPFLPPALRAAAAAAAQSLSVPPVLHWFKFYQHHDESATTP